MKREDDRRIQDIIDAIEHIIMATQSKTEQEFCENEVLQAAVTKDIPLLYNQIKKISLTD